MVNILSNADDSTITTVTRQVGREKILYKAPTCIREYNQCMQGVDRIDQLRARFSIADGHTFKKWHKKLALAYIDIARCNAYIARKLSGSMTSVRDPHREFMMNLSSELISGEWMNSLGDVGMMLGDPALVNCDGVMTPVAASPRIASPAKTRDECDLRSSKQVFPESRAKRECVICRFEGRWPSEQTVYCYNHKVSLCATVHRALGSSTFLCPDQDATCLDKYHRFYYPAGLFNANGNIRRSCSIFKAKKQADLQARVPSTVNEDSECNYLATTDLEYDGSSIEQHENANNVSFASSVPEQDMSFYGSETSFASRESMGSIDYCGRIVELPVSNPIQDTNANQNDSPIVLYNVSL
jgi:Transposase IS4